MKGKSFWPYKKKCAVIITVDYHDIEGALTQYPQLKGREKSLSVWRYGSLRGVDRLLNLLNEKDIKSTWCIPSSVAKKHSNHIYHLIESGHEVACSGAKHEDYSNLSLKGQIANLQTGVKELTNIMGRRPEGFRIPAGHWQQGFVNALHDEGITWSSSWRGDDIPFFHVEKPIIETPLHYELEDAPYFAFNLSPAVPVGQSRIASYSETLENMKLDFEGFYRLGLCYVLRLHPEIIGTAGRIQLLSSLIDFIQSKSGVWITTASDIARWWQTQPSNTQDHPANIYFKYVKKHSHNHF
ncbi:polysaccharide deacetylase family protein [Vreelandella olivaria]|uniref:polysaccharide deacetylase family protein n=1 Tax=Vreelandella olivaria TaxID=390919 RepID=UPI00201F7026|nr:polysaccharide deacetylase family protein [Halomonas olivaria]